MKLPDKNELIILGYCTFILLIIGIAGMIFSNTNAKGMFSLLFAVLFYLILPGYFIMLNFNFDGIERIVLGMIVSSAVIPAILYALNILGFKITTGAIVLSILSVVLLSIIYRKRKESANELY